jgi:hypothetical protein
MRQGSLLSPFLFNIVLKFLARAITQEEIKGMQIGQMSLFADDVILYLKDPKNSAPKLLDTIKSYSKVTRFKTHLTEIITILYTSNKQTEKKYMETIPFTIA